MVKPVFNKTILKTPGDIMVSGNPNKIRMRTYTEGYFMQKSPLSKDYIAPDKTNPVVKFFKQMAKTLKEIIEATKPENVNEKSAGMTFEA